MAQLVTLMMASRGCSISGSDTWSHRDVLLAAPHQRAHIVFLSRDLGSPRSRGLKRIGLAQQFAIVVEPSLVADRKSHCQHDEGDCRQDSREDDPETGALWDIA